MLVFQRWKTTAVAPKETVGSRTNLRKFMRIFTTVILVTSPVIGAAQLAPDEFCEDLSTFERLTPEEYESLQQWSEDYIDAIFSSRSQDVHLSDAMPEDWLRSQVAKHVADCHMTGRGTERNIERAMAVLEIPASSGDSGSAHMLASMRVFQSDDPELQRKGFLTLKQEADDGSAYSAGKLGWAYALGRGTEKSEQRALEQYFIAAKAGMTYWQFLLAHAYEQGYYGLPIDPDRAAYWRELEYYGDSLPN
jgi:TPR repeat protein